MYSLFPPDYPPIQKGNKSMEVVDKVTGECMVHAGKTCRKYVLEKFPLEISLVRKVDGSKY